jgi:hypothetical protein
LTNSDPIAEFSYLAERDQALDYSRCFLCGTRLHAGNRTDEHVFPQWLLGDFALHNERLGLFNGTTIPYRSLKIPCCHDCNTVWLRRIEDVVSVAVRAGPESVMALDTTALAVWMTKIFYGLLFKDLSLAADRLHPTGDTVVDDAMLVGFAELHHVLQLARKRVELSGQTPATVFVLRTLDSSDPRRRFDYRDVFTSPFLAIRMGNVGLIACLLDWGAVGDLQLDHLHIARGLESHPTQFAQIAALCAHWRRRLNRVPKHIAISGRGSADQLITLPLAGLSTKPIFDEFDVEDYAHLLAHFTGYDIERLWYRDTRQLWMSLTTADDKPIQAPSADLAIEPPIRTTHSR